MELHSMANASSFSGDSSTSMNNDDEIKKPIESEEEEQEQSTDEIKIMIESMEEKLNKVSSSQSRCDIYHVSRMIYEQKPDAYKPRVVSIGLLHHNDKHLWITETTKLQYMDCLLRRCEKTFGFCVKALNCLEEEARKCYSDTMNLGKGEFVKMMVMDGCFILEFLHIAKTGEGIHLVLDEAWASEIVMDMFMLENQLPFSILEHLDALLFNHDHEFSFSEHTYDWFIEGLTENLGGPILSSAEELESSLQAEGGPKHLLDLLRFVLIPSSPWEILSNELYVQLDYNASQLKSAGIKFQKKEDASNLFDIHFDKGVLTIPTIKMFDQTELLLRNLMAFEQGKPATNRYFTAYATFMDGLIDTDKDVALLTEQGIIINCLGSPEIVAATFNNITKGVFMSPYFSGVVKDLNDYYNKPWNKLMENLRQTYFNSPWAGISVAAAAVVIILAIIQTICSLLQI